MLTKSLFQPFQYGSLRLPNRIVMAPMTRKKSINNIPGEDVAAYYQRRAEGGVGLIITEGTAIPHVTARGQPNVPHFYGEAALQGWQLVVDSVHAVGGYIVPQLWHVGSVRHFNDMPEVERVSHAPSAIMHPYLPDMTIQPSSMSKHDIDEIIAAYVTAAVSAQQLGFDGIELHGAHGYLIDQFFWSLTNHRTDQYGGIKLADRTRFATEIIASIRHAVGKDYPVIFRFSQWKLGDYEHKLAKNPHELADFLQPLVDAGVDIFHCSTRRFHQPEFENSALNLAGWTKKLTGKPTITVGSIGLDTEFHLSMRGASTKADNIDELLERLEKQEFDLVALGRSLIADPAWPKKIAAGKLSEINVFNKVMLDTLE